MSPEPFPSTVHGLVALCVKRQPASCAVAGSSGASPPWSYSALWRAAGSVAEALLEKWHVQHGDLVAALCGDTGLALACVELAVLRIGAGFLPMDVAWPDGRLAFQLQDARATAAVCLEVHMQGLQLRLERVGGGVEVPLVAFEALVSHRKTGRKSIEGPGVCSDDICHAIYTSGSTGQPKACFLPHRALVNYMIEKSLVHGITAQSRILLVSAPTWDPSLGDIFSTLACGATLCVAPRGQLLEDLASAASRSVASHACATPGQWGMIPQDSSLPAMRVLALGGEPMPSRIVERWGGLKHDEERHEQVPTLINLYGVTEVCVYQTAERCWRRNHREDSHLAGHARQFTCGRPYRNVVLRLQRANNDTSEEEAEILFGGVQLANGYLNRPELTSEKFIYAGEERCFCTGDIGRWVRSNDTDESNLLVLGRRDNQVKLRGIRVELGEIENIIADATLGLVSSTVCAKVLSKPVNSCEEGKEAQSNETLVAYVMPAPGVHLESLRDDAPGSVAIRLHCQSVLPYYMMPQRFVPLEKFPLLASGKVDRRSLPIPEERALRSTAVDQITRARENLATPTERHVAESWVQALALQKAPDSLRVTDHFFDLGGTSAAAIEMLRLLAERMGQDFSSGEAAHVRLCGLLRKPRLRDYAAFLDLAGTEAPGFKGSSENPTSASLNAGEDMAELFLLRAAALEGGSEKDVGADALRVAAGSGDVAVAKALLRCGVPAVGDRGSRDQRKMQAELSPLMLAAKKGSEECCQILLVSAADPNLTDTGLRTAAHHCVGEAACPPELRVHCLRSLLLAQAALEARDAMSWGLLHHATWSGSEQVTEAVLQARAAIDRIDRWERSALAYAVTQRHDKVLLLLLAHQAAIDGNGGKVPQRALRRRRGMEKWQPVLHLAVEAGCNSASGAEETSHRWCALKALLDHPVQRPVSFSGTPLSSWHLRDDEGRTALHAALTGAVAGDGLHESLDQAMVAFREGSAMAVKLLLEARSDGSAKDASQGRTPLHYAVQAGNLPAVEFLLLHDESLSDAKDREGLTAAALGRRCAGEAGQAGAKPPQLLLLQELQLLCAKAAAGTEACSQSVSSLSERAVPRRVKHVAPSVGDGREFIQKGRFGILCTNEKAKPQRAREKEVICFRCNQPGHWAKDCDRIAQCRHCGGSHESRTCDQNKKCS